MIEVDVVVVGGRIAGSLTALRMAAQGLSVGLFEAHDFPSDTLSTHFFRGDGLVRSLDEVGVLDEVLATGAPPLRCEYFSADHGPFTQGQPQEPGIAGFSLSVRRSTLDVILARRAAAVADVHTRSKVVDVIRRDGAVVGVVDERGGTHHARLVVGADGRRSTVAALAGAAVVERAEPARALYYRYATGWRSPDMIGPEFALDGDNLLYVFPSDAGVACIAVSVPIAHHEQPGHRPTDKLESALRANPRTADRAEAIEWISRVFVGLPADSLWRQAYGPGWALVGDAGTAQDPWAGLGMDTAARQAEALAEAVGTSTDGWGPLYEGLRHERTYDAYAQTTRLAPDLRMLLQ